MERAVIIAETRGQSTQTEPIGQPTSTEPREEKERRVPSNESPTLEKAEVPEKKKSHRRISPPTAHKTSDAKKERVREAEKIPIRDANADANI